jgi:DNA sulfur modification protein DndC
LEAQSWIRENGPEHVRDLELITREELQEIRRIWVLDKHEMEDSLPQIYEQATKEKYLGPEVVNHHAFGQDEMRILREICDGDELHFQLIRELLDIEAGYRTHSRRRGLFDALESAFQRNAYAGIEDATARARQRRDALKAARDGSPAQLDLALGGGDSSAVS